MSTPEIPAPSPETAGAIGEVLALISLSVTKARSSDDARDLGDWAKGILALSQAAAILDPARVAGGDHPAAQRASVPAPTPTRDTDSDGVVGEK